VSELARKDMILKLNKIFLWLLVGSSGRIHQGVKVDTVGIIIGNLEFFHLPRFNEELHESQVEAFLGYLDYLRVIPFGEEYN